MYNSFALFLKELIFFLYRIYWSFFIAPALKKKRPPSPRLLWGTTPLITNKYFSEALKNIGFESHTLMWTYYSINKKEDFDFYIRELFPGYEKRFIHIIKYLQAIRFIAKNFDIIHTPFNGIISSDFKYMKQEVHMLKKAGCKFVNIPYGGDYMQYSRLQNTTLRHGILMSYPDSAKIEAEIRKKVEFWQIESDCLMSGFQVDGIGRWDVLPFCYYVVNVDEWRFKQKYSAANGVNASVKIVHAPNHKGFKGTEFIFQAIQELKAEGLKIEFLFLEKKSNTELMKIISDDADILIDQIILGYGIIAVEAMAAGTVAISALEYENYNLLFRRYSYLNECPVVSVNHETLKENIKKLVTQPDLRESLGRSGRKYAEKYHSYKSAQYLFSKIYDRIWHKKEVDLINLYHPLQNNSYNNTSDQIKHPLVNNHIPNN